MYIKNNEQTYICGLCDKRDFVTQISFMLNEKPELIGDLIELYSSEGYDGLQDSLIRTINRKHYDREIVEEKNGKFYLTLTNIPEPTEKEIETKKHQQFKRHKDRKLENLNLLTQSNIQKGIDYRIDDQTKHFKLEEQDQQNIIMICQYLMNNQDVAFYPYKADGEEMANYSRENLLGLHAAMVQHITENRNHFHETKQKIEKATSLEELDNINLHKE